MVCCHAHAGQRALPPNLRPPGAHLTAHRDMCKAALLCVIHDVTSGHGLQLARQVAGPAAIQSTDLGAQSLVLGT